MNSLLGPLLAFCAAGALAVALTVLLGAYLARRHNRALDRAEAAERSAESTRAASGDAETGGPA